jgi:multidrug efflux pump subunit AcrA (membrane-fusion protein)
VETIASSSRECLHPDRLSHDKSDVKSQEREPMTVQPAGMTPTEVATEAVQGPSLESNGLASKGRTEPAPNGSPNRSHSRLPATRRLGLGAKLIILFSAIALVVSGGAGSYAWYHSLSTARTDILTAPVRKGKLAITVKERGILESAENNDVTCRVRARTQNATVATTIKWVIDDGSHVKKGDLLVDLDDSGLVENLKAQNITVDKARADWISAQEQYKITISQNESDLQTKRTTLELAKIDLEKYQKGDFPQSLKDVEGRIKVAESDLEQQRDRAAWAQRMLKKGYYTVSQADAEQSKLQSLQLALAKVQEEKRVLTDPTYGLKKRTETDYQNKVVQAKDELERAEGQARAKELTSRTDRDSKKSILDQELAKQKDLEDEIKKCKIYAPQDGLVVYYVPEQTRFGSGSQQSIVAQGEPVREGQKLMRIPDLKHMMVNTRVHEALVSNVRGETRDDRGKIDYRGQDARVRVDAYPDRELKAHVKSVATVAAQSDWMSSDVKMYVTMIAIDEVPEGLKPGMSAEVTILVDKTRDDKVIIPVQAIMGTTAMGQKRICWVKTETGYEEREIVVGASNEREAAIESGLKQGDQVVLNYRLLEEERIKSKRPTIADRHNDEADSKSTDWGKTPSQGSDLEKTGKAPDSPPGRGDQKEGEKKKAGKSGAGKKDGKGKGGFGNMSPEDRQKMMQQMIERFKNASPEERKNMLNQSPNPERTREWLKSQGIDVPQ